MDPSGLIQRKKVISERRVLPYILTSKGLGLPSDNLGFTNFYLNICDFLLVH